jgi:hypothetical protein
LSSKPADEISSRRKKHGSLMPGLGDLVFVVVFFTLSGCDLFTNSMVEYFEDNTGVVTVMGAVGKTRHAVTADGTILIPPAADVPTTTIGMALFNPRNFTLRQELLGVPAGTAIASRQTGSNEIEVHISGAREGDMYNLTLVLQSPDGLREFPPYNLALRCVSFETALLDFTVDGNTPPGFAPNQAAFTVNVPHGAAAVALAGTTLNPNATLEVYAGTDDSSAALARGTGTVSVSSGTLSLGDNSFYLKVTAPSLHTQGYGVTIFRGYSDSKAITDFSITSPVKAAGAIDETLKTIRVNVPYGTNVNAMTAKADHTGTSISPDPAEARSYAGPVTYTVSAADGTAQAYTVTVSVGAAGTNAELSGLAITTTPSSTGTLDPAFSAGTPTYTVLVPYNTTSITLTGTPADPAAAVKYSKTPGPWQNSGTFTGGLVQGVNEFQVQVTAQDGTKLSPIYTVTVVLPKGVTDLSDIDDLNGFYQLTGSLALTGWTPIGTAAQPFTGVFDGGGYTVTLAGTPSALNDPDIGLFAYTDGAEIRDVTVAVSCSFTTTLSDKQNIGGVVGRAKDTAFENVAVTGTLTISATGTSGDFAAGGLAGQLSGMSSVSGCYSMVNITVPSSSRDVIRVGGLVGDGTEATEIKKSFATGKVEASTSGSYVWAGGLVGITSLNASIENCYATGDVTGTAKANAYAGGLVGEFDGIPCHTTCTKSYASGGVSATTSTPSDISAAGGIAGKINSGAGLTFCAAISGSVTSSGSSPACQYAGAVAGYVDTNVTFTNNKARRSIVVDPSNGVTVTPDNGEMGDSISYADFADPLTYTALGWTFPGIWEMRGSRPALRGITPP